MPSVDFEWQWDRVRLHNVSADPSEQVDIKDLHKEKVQDMMKHLKEMTKTMPSQSIIKNIIENGTNFSFLFDLLLSSKT